MSAVEGAVLAAAAEGHRQLPVPPWAIGLGAFVLLLVLLMITLLFGKGRPHS